MGIIEIDKLDTLLARHAELKAAVDAFGQTLNEVQRYANETNTVVKDILTGKQISDWIADLAASGKSSATYLDAAKMQALAESSDAVRNISVSQHIFDWCIDNKMVANYYNSYFGAVSGVTWLSLTTPSLVCANANAFGKIANEQTTIDTALSNSKMKSAIWNNYNVTRPIMTSSTVLNLAAKHATTNKKRVDNNMSFLNGRFFVYKLVPVEDANGIKVELTYIDGNKIKKEVRFGNTWILNDFVADIVNIRGYDSVMNMTYIDFR